jgi:predicted DNA binding CopG/RHH family protein
MCVLELAYKTSKSFALYSRYALHSPIQITHKKKDSIVRMSSHLLACIKIEMTKSPPYVRHLSPVLQTSNTATTRS